MFQLRIWKYDFKGNPVYLRKRFCEVYDQTIDWDGSPTLLSDVFNTEISYDAMNRPTEIIQPDASVVAYAFNKAGLLETVQAKIRGITTYTEFVTNIDYNEKGQRTDIYYRNGSKTAYTYDTKSFRLVRLKTTRDSGNDTLQEINYTYDAVGNITETEDIAQQTFYYSNSVIAPRGKYWYDALYRLTKATGRELSSLAIPSDTDFTNNIPVPNTDSSAMQNYTQEYRYDELGNINQMKSVGDWTRDYYYETANNRLKNHDNQIDVYSYDEHGNCTEMPHLPELIWDHKDELKEVTLNASNHKAYYAYDASGERVRKVVDKGSVVEERLYLGGFEIYRKTVSGTLDYERETLKITEGRNTIAQLETKTVENGNTISTPTTNQRFQYSNHLGSACLELDNSANIISYEEYHPFGTTSYRSGSSETEVSLKRYKYVGKERDEETGLYYYGARYYAAWIARFLSVDPLQFEYAHLNPYNYAGNKPIVGIDLDGFQSTQDEITNNNESAINNNFVEIPGSNQNSRAYKDFIQNKVIPFSNSEKEKVPNGPIETTLIKGGGTDNRDLEIITLNGVFINCSNVNVDMEETLQDIKEYFEEMYKTENLDGKDYQFELNLRIVDSMNETKDTDYILALADEINHANSDEGDIYGVSGKPGGLVAYVDAHLFNGPWDSTFGKIGEFTVAHEFGHLLGLAWEKNHGSPGSWNLMHEQAPITFAGTNFTDLKENQFKKILQMKTSGILGIGPNLGQSAILNDIGLPSKTNRANVRITTNAPRVSTLYK